MPCIEARGLRKAFGTTVALDGIDLRVEEGRILGLIGPNGAGKTTALNAILGLTPFEGQLKVLGRDPWTERDQLMRDVCFIADVAVLPRWMRVSQALDYVGRRASPVRPRKGGRLPRPDRHQAHEQGPRAVEGHGDPAPPRPGHGHRRAAAGAGRADARPRHPVSQDSSTTRCSTTTSTASRTIVVTTHQVEEIQHVLTDVVFIDRGRIVLECSMEDVRVALPWKCWCTPSVSRTARALKPIHERQTFGRSILLFDGVDRQQLAALGDVRTPSLADLFVAVMGAQAVDAQGVAR